MVRLQAGLSPDTEQEWARRREEFISPLMQLLMCRSDQVGVVGLADDVAMGVLDNV